MAAQALDDLARIIKNRQPQFNIYAEPYPNSNPPLFTAATTTTTCLEPVLRANNPDLYSFRVLAVDPGTTHLVAAIFECDQAGSLHLRWSNMFKVDKDPTKMARAAKLMVGMCKEYKVPDAVVEFQAPIGNLGSSRWNTYVEGAISACLAMGGVSVHSLSASAVKNKLGLATGNYAQNKRMAFEYARKRCNDIDTHHTADCFCLAEYYKLDVLKLEEENFEEDC